MFSLSVKMMKKEIKSALFYTIAMTIAITMTFIFSSIINNQTLKSNTIATGGGTWQNVTLPISECLSLVVVCFCCFLIFYVNNYYVMNKKQEIAVLSTSGSSVFKTTMYLLYQTALLFIVACIPGLLLGYQGTVLLNQYIAGVLNQKPEPITMSSLVFTGMLIFTIFIMLVVVVAGYVYRHDVKSILYSKDNMNVTGVLGKMKIPGIVFVGIYVAGLVLLAIMAPDSYSTYLLACLLGICGLIFGGITDMVKSWKKKHLYTNRYRSVSLSNLSYTVIKSKWLLVLIIFSVTILYGLSITYANLPKEFIVSAAGYVITVILLTVTIMYNLMIEAKSRATLYYNMWKVGYTKKELVKIIKQEMLMYYGFLTLAPLLVIVCMSVNWISHQMLEMNLFLVLSGIYVVMIIFTGCITYYVYKQSIQESIVGER